MKGFGKFWFWVVLIVVSIGSAGFAFRFFGVAFPIVELDLELDRSTALDRARELAERRGWGPEDFRQAASFGVESEVQNFVELEGGGKEAFSRLLRSDLYSPYVWRVRHFQELTANETEIRFTPAGEPDGFSEQLAESEPGAALESEAARAIAEEAATGEWGVDLGAYEPIEQSREVRIGGRVDHTFVYESPRRDIGEGRYRLTLVVAGDKLAGLARWVKVPEAFGRRYAEMRSANNTIGVAGGAAAVVLYLVGGCFVGLILLMRKGWALWKRAALWGVFIALLQALASLNSLPLAWMGYDTADSYQGFMLQRIVLTLVEFATLALLVGLSLMAAESLTRRAFPGQLQLWKVWSGGVANSGPVLGQTVAGYLLVPLFFAYEVALYFVATRTLGWWSPSDALVQPDVLANYIPWLTAIAVSAQAGFWEECLFRAIPLAGAALLGERFGGRKYWIGGALLLQAVIFGAGHAPYPAQPAYARVVELVIPSLFFGAIYLVYGLLPGIVLHFAFDVVWFAIPVFLSRAPGSWVDQTMLVAVTLTPLWAVLWRRWRRGRWERLSEDAYNGSWSPVAVQPEAVPVQAPVPEAAMGSGLKLAAAAAGIGGLLLWVFFGHFQNDAGKLETSRAEAVAAARGTLAERGVQLGDPWWSLPRVSGGVGEADRFIWMTAGPDRYRDLLGDYLDPPGWSVRFARFEGDLQERAEEFLVDVDGRGEVLRLRHSLPEARPGASIAEEDARRMALQRILQAYGLSGDGLREVSAEPAQRPNRLDWKFTFADTAVKLDEGEARIAVEIAGDEVVDVYRGVHVPEEWSRRRRNLETIAGIIDTFSSLLLALMFLAGLVAAALYWSRRAFPTRTGLVFGAAVVLLMAANLAGRWPAILARLSTDQPLRNQILAVLFGGLITSLLAGVAVGLNAGFVHAWRRPPAADRGWMTALAGFSAGLAGIGLARVLSSFQSREIPRWPNFAPLDSVFPIFASAVSILLLHLALGVLLLLVFVCLDRFSDGWTRRRALTTGGLLLFGVLAGGTLTSSPERWLPTGFAIGMFLAAAYVSLLRFNLTLVPMALAGALVPGLLEQTRMDAFPGAAAAAGVAAVLVTAQAALWWRALGPK